MIWQRNRLMISFYTFHLLDKIDRNKSDCSADTYKSFRNTLECVKQILNWTKRTSPHPHVYVCERECECESVCLIVLDIAHLLNRIHLVCHASNACVLFQHVLQWSNAFSFLIEIVYCASETKRDARTNWGESGWRRCWYIKCTHTQTHSHQTVQIHKLSWNYTVCLASENCMIVQSDFFHSRPVHQFRFVFDSFTLHFQL